MLLEEGMVFSKFTLDQPDETEAFQRVAELVWVQQVMPQVAMFPVTE